MENYIPIIISVTMVIIQILIGFIMMGNNRILDGIKANIENLYKRLDLYRLSDTCKEIHALEKQNTNERFTNVKTQIDGVANIARTKRYVE